MRFIMETIYNVILLALTLEEIATIIYSSFNRPFANISLQVYPTLILIGNIGSITKLLNIKIIFFEINILEKKGDILIQIFYLVTVFIFMILILIFGIEEKTFDEKMIILFMKEKNKLIYINGIVTSLINLFEIIYLIYLYLNGKTIFTKEKTEASINADDLARDQNWFISN